MLGFKVKLIQAENAKMKLLAEGLFDKEYLVKREPGFLVYPVTKKISSLTKQFDGSEFIESGFERSKIKQSYKDFIPEAETGKDLPSSYDVIGDIIIIDISDAKQAKTIGAALLKANRNIKTILRKSGHHEGEFRTQKLSYVCGERKKETIYKENNIRLKLDVEKVYFSPRLSSERKRIIDQIHPGEKVLVLFSGCGPYPIGISKNTHASKIVAIEKNPVAHKYAVLNNALNKTKNIEFFQGDVKEIVPTLGQKFDRILMPLPKGAEDFLPVAFSAAKSGTVINFYDFEHEKEISNGEIKIKEAATKNNTEVKILRTVKCGSYSPGKFRICVDFVILKHAQ